MSILDDAIREHLELKRAHGADDEELKKLEDEAFGPPQRPDEVDPFAEAPTEFLLSPGDTAAEAPEVGDEAARGGRRPNITDLQEAPPPTPPEGTEVADAPAADAPALAPDEDLSPAPDAPPPSLTDAAEVPLPPPVDEAVDEHPAREHPIVDDPGPNTAERHAITDQPTQMFDVQAEIEAETAEAVPAEQLVDATQSEPHAAPPAPEDAAGPPTEIHEQPPLDTRGPDAEVAGHPPTEEESAEFDFFNEQRLSDELDQALEAPLPPTDEHGLPGYEDSGPAQGGVFDFEREGPSYEEDPSEEVPYAFDPPSEETPRPPAEPPSEEAPGYEPPSEETPRDVLEPPSEEAPRDPAEPLSEESDLDYDPDTGHEDVLEDTPRFLEDAPEDDDLWFEQKPPKDFDLD
jgi:hypothetical protein